MKWIKKNLYVITIIALIIVLAISYYKSVEGFQSDANDPKSANVVVEGKLSTLTDPYYLRIFAGFGTGRRATEFKNAQGENVLGDAMTKTEYSISDIQNSSSQVVWRKGEPITRIKSATGSPEKMASGENQEAFSKDDSVAKYMLRFTNPINLRVIQTDISKKVPNVSYVGLKFSDTATKGPSYLERADTLKPEGNASKLRAKQEDEEITKKFLASTKTRREQDLENSRYTGQILETNEQLQASGMMPGLVTNRIRVRGRYSDLIKADVRAQLERGVGSNAKVIEIIDSVNKQIWPTGKDVRYTDSGRADVFVVGFDKSFDVNKTIGPFMKRNRVSGIQFMSAAVPRKA